MNLSRALLVAATVFAAPAMAADPALLEAARREGQVTWYTSQIIDQLARPLAARFEQVTGVKVNYVRTDAAGGALRIFNEARAGRTQADVFDAASTSTLVKEGLVLSHVPDSARRLPGRFVDPRGFWLATNLYFYTPGINTDLVPEAARPNTFRDLLHPRFRGRMAWSSRASTSSAPGFVGAVFAAMGEENGRKYLAELARQNIAPVTVSARQLLDQVIAGEYDVAIQILNNHASISAAQGAPVTWRPLETTLRALSVVSATKDAPHPAAARLFLDFLMSREGQTVYRDSDYIPVDPDVPPKDARLRPDGLSFRTLEMSPDEIEAAMPRWHAIFQDIFR